MRFRIVDILLVTMLIAVVLASILEYQRRKAFLRSEHIHELRFTDDDSVFSVHYQSGRVRQWYIDATSLTPMPETRTLQLDTSVQRPTQLPGSSCLAPISGDQDAMVFCEANLITGELEELVSVPYRCAHYSLDLKTSLLATCSGHDQQADIWDMNTGQKVVTLKYPHEVNGVKFWSNSDDDYLQGVTEFRPGVNLDEHVVISKYKRNRTEYQPRLGDGRDHSSDQLVLWDKYELGDDPAIGHWNMTRGKKQVLRIGNGYRVFDLVTGDEIFRMPEGHRPIILGSGAVIHYSHDGVLFRHMPERPWDFRVMADGDHEWRQHTFNDVALSEKERYLALGRNNRIQIIDLKKMKVVHDFTDYQNQKLAYLLIVFSAVMTLLLGVRLIYVYSRRAPRGELAIESLATETWTEASPNA